LRKYGHEHWHCARRTQKRKAYPHSTFPTESGNGTLIFVSGDGIPTIYREGESGIWKPDSGVEATTDSIVLTGTGDPVTATGFIHRTKGGIESVSIPTVSSRRSALRSGRKVTLTRDAKTGKVVALTFRSSVTYAFDYEGSAISTITAPDGSRIAFSYKAGCLPP
jgi:hypothetical protein